MDRLTLRSLDCAMRHGAAPVIAGPLDIGLLAHHPGSGQPIGSDHYVVVLDVDDHEVHFHDPDGFPYVSLPTSAFIDAWRADSIDYTSDQFAYRSDFRCVRRIRIEDALRVLPATALKWLSPTGPDRDRTAGAAVLKLADLVVAGPAPSLQDHLVHFAVRVGARRLSDASDMFEGAGYARASEILKRQAQLLGGVQYELVSRDLARAGAALHELAPLYEELRAELAASTGQGR